MKLRCGRFTLDLDRPKVMAIVNLTDDSFSGDGLGADTGRAIDAALRQLDAGADLLDLGAESSRPGARPIAAAEELDRLLPVVEALAEAPIPISVDTCKPEVMRAVLAAGASMINDIRGFASPGAVAAVAGSDCGLCVMHMQGEPGTMQRSPSYRDVVADVRAWLLGRVAELSAAGVGPERICVDPGFGFGKSLAHNLELFRALPEFAAGGRPVLVGVSRKSMLGTICQREAGDRMPASVAAAVLAAERGAAILRVHDVGPTRDALAVLKAIAAEAGGADQ